MPQSTGHVTAFSHVNPSTTADRNPPVCPLAEVICFTQLLFQSVKYWRNLQRLVCFMGCPVLGCQEGRIGQLLMEGERLT